MLKWLKLFAGIGWRSALAWSVLFLGPELAAHYRLNRWQAAIVIYAAATVCVLLWPILTFSGTVWDGEAFWPVVIPTFVAVFAGVLVLGHFELHWSVRYVILTAIVGVTLLVSHVLERAHV